MRAPWLASRSPRTVRAKSYLYPHCETPFRWIAGALAGFACVTACADNWEYTIKKGDTLIGLANRYFVDPTRWYDAQVLNNVRNPRRLQPGTPLYFPLDWLKDEPAKARVTGARGSINVTSATQPSGIPARTGDSLPSGARISAGANSSATIQFEDGSTALVLSETDLALSELTRKVGAGVAATVARLERGRIETRVKPQSRSTSRYEIQTPVVNMGVRGTDFRVAFDAEGAAARSEVLEGLVRAANAQGDASLAQGEGTVVARDAPPSAPIPILPQPNLDAVSARVERLPVRFRWETMADAVGYRVQLAADNTFAALISEGVFREPEAKFADLEDGRYVIRVRGVDRHGLEGHSAQRPIEVKARPEPPFLESPKTDGTVRGDRPKFAWAQVTEAATYRFQLAADAQFSSPIIDVPRLARASYAVEQALPPADYYWRVASWRANGDAGPFGDPQRFVLKAIPMFQAEVPPALSEAAVTLRWKAGAPGQKYRVQLARNDRFDPLLKDVTLDAPSIELLRPSGGTLFMRVQVLDTDGFAGPFGSTQRVDIPPQYPELKLITDRDKAEFTWSALGEGRKLHLQFSRESSFAKPLVDRIAEAPPIAIARPVGPQFFARMAVIDADGFVGPLSKTTPVQIATLYPGLSSPELERGQLTFKWSELPTGSRLRYQVASDAEFGTVLHDEVHTGMQFQMENPGTGEYFLRVALIDANGYASPFGPAHRFEVPREFPWPVLLVLPLLLL